MSRLAIRALQCAGWLLVGIAHAEEAVNRLVCVGRVEPAGGEVEVSAQMSGTLAAVLVKEGDWVAKGAVLAEVEATREKAALDVARAKLARLKAGYGREEIAAADANREAVAAELALAESEHERATKLREQKVFAEDVLDQRRQRVATLRKQLAGVEKQLEAMRRGALPEDIAVGEAEVEAAKAAYDLRLIRASADGVVLHLYRHAGDLVSLSFPSPILRMADTRRLRVRVEVNEQDVYRVQAGMAGEFATYGATKPNGRLVVKTILPSFAPRRLFEPDSTARMDTRTLQVLCEVAGDSAPVFSGQRVTATFEPKGQ